MSCWSLSLRAKVKARSPQFARKHPAREKLKHKLRDHTAKQNNLNNNPTQPKRSRKGIKKKNWTTIQEIFFSPKEAQNERQDFAFSIPLIYFLFYPPPIAQESCKYQFFSKKIWNEHQICSAWVAVVVSHMVNLARWWCGGGGGGLSSLALNEGQLVDVGACNWF